MSSCRYVRRSRREAGTNGSAEIKLWSICTHIGRSREPMDFGPGWIRSLPAKASEVNTALGVEDHALLCEHLLFGGVLY